MNQFELETLLLDPEGFQKLAQQAKSALLDNQTSVSGAPSAEVKPVDPAIGSIEATPEEIARTDLKRISRSSLLEKIGDFVPQLKDKSSREALQTVLQWAIENPMGKNQFLFQDAINRLTQYGCVEEQSGNIVKKAIFDFVDAWGRRDPDTTGAVYTNLFQHPDLNGNSIFAFLGVNSIYYSIREQFLKNVGLHDAISSLTLDSTNQTGRGDIILFQDDRYFGRFRSYRTNLQDASQQVTVNYVGDYMNDRTSSVLLVRRFEGEKIAALGDQITKLIITTIVKEIDQVKEVRDPIFTWDMWPTGGDDHPNDPGKRFIEVKIPVLIDPDDWLWDYNAEIRLWFYLYISGGELKGYLAHYGAWVSGGLISERVLRCIMDALPGKIGLMNDLLNAKLSQINIGGPFRYVYLLPGDQSLFTGSSYQGHIQDNVSVVLVPESIPFELEYVVDEIFY